MGAERAIQLFAAKQNKGYILSLVERKSRFGITKRLTSKNSSFVSYFSWQHDLNENWNFILKRWLLESTNFLNITEQD